MISLHFQNGPYSTSERELTKDHFLISTPLSSFDLEVSDLDLDLEKSCKTLVMVMIMYNIKSPPHI